MKILALLVLAQVAPSPSADELLKKVDDTPGLKEQDKPFEIAASLGRLYTGKGRLPEAKAYYEQALAKAEPLRAFLLAQKRPASAKALPTAQSVGCAPTKDDSTVVALLAKAKTLDAGGALVCARAAWAPVAEVEVQYGNLLFVLHDSASALAVYNRALDASEANADARYGRAALLLDTKGDDPATLKHVKADFERFLKDAPSSSRAPQAKRLLDRATAALEKGGISKVPVATVAMAAEPPPAQGQPPQLSPEVIRAFENTPRTASMEAGFAQSIEAGEDHLAHGRFEEARKSYLQVMPYQPTNPRLKAGMAWAMIQLNRQPMADTVWRAAIQAPDAVSALGDTLKAKGDAEGARALWSRLKASVPAYAPRLEGKL